MFDPPASVILAETAAQFDMTVAQLISRKRCCQAHRFARRLAIWRLRQGGRSLNQIGRELGGLDHTTVLAALKTYAREASP